MRVNLALLFVIVAMLGGSSILGQSPNASISGVVLDQDKKSIAEAEILVVNDYTRVQYEAKTNAEGFFAVTNLPPGQYRIQVSKVGFKAIIKPDIILNVQDALAINFTLPIGASSVVVTVEGGAPMVNTTDASVSTVVDRQFAENLPLNGRSFQTLIELTPGVVLTVSNTSDNGQFSVNGQRASSNYWVLDGVSANTGIGAVKSGNGVGGTVGSFSALGGTNSLVSVDAMQEFRIQTSTFAPEFGRSPGAQISIVTRSGTNLFHGAVFDYLRNDVLDANNWFANSVGLAKPEERQNDFGGTFSGPVLKNKTFFFFSYEGLRLRLPQTELSNVPDLNARQNASSSMQGFLNAFPLPTANQMDVGPGIAPFDASYSNPATLDAYSLRVDHKLTESWNLFARYSYSPSEFKDRGGTLGNAALSTVQPVQINTQSFTAGATWLVSHAMTNDLRFNYSETSANRYSYLDDFGGAIPPPNLPFPSGYTGANAFFNFNIESMGPGAFIQSGQVNRNHQHQINLVDGLSWQVDSHELKVGVDGRRLSPLVVSPDYLQSVFFSTVADSETGSSFFGGIYAYRRFALLFHNLGAYAQDTWRVMPRLTLTYGLRWDVDFAPSSQNDFSIPAVTGYRLTDFSQLAIAPTGTPPFQTNYGSLAPRLGVAYQLDQNPSHQTVLRGGVGIFYDLVSAETGNLLSAGGPPFENHNFLFNQTFPFAPAQSAPVSIPDPSLAYVYAFNPNLKIPYTLEWNIALQQGLGLQQTVSVTYVGASGRRLLQTAEVFNPPSNPNLGTGLFIDNTADSDYNGLQVQFQRRLSHGLQALASYTWSHSIDTASASSNGVASNLSLPGSGNGNRASSDFDIRNAFTMGLTYDFPGPRGNGFLRAIARGWSTENFFIARSAPPVDLSDTNFFAFDTGISANVRPDRVAGQPLYLYGAQCLVAAPTGFGQSCPGGKGFNPNAFTNPPSDPNTGNPLRQGTLGRNVLRGYGAAQWDFAVHRDFPIRESLKLQFRAEMFNVLNHPNFGPPSGLFGQERFGLSTKTLGQSLSNNSLGAGGFNPLYQIGGPRSVQLALKLTF